LKAAIILAVETNFWKIKVL